MSRPRSTGVEIIVCWITAVATVAVIMQLVNATWWLSLLAGSATTLIIGGIAARTHTTYYDHTGKRVRL